MQRTKPWRGTAATATTVSQMGAAGGACMVSAGVGIREGEKGN